MAIDNAAMNLSSDSECPDGTCPLKQPSASFGGHKIGKGTTECKTCGGGPRRRLASSASTPMGRRGARTTLDGSPVKVSTPSPVPSTVVPSRSSDSGPGSLIVPSRLPDPPHGIVVSPRVPGTLTMTPNSDGMLPSRAQPKVSVVTRVPSIIDTIGKGMAGRRGAIGGGTATANGQSAPIKVQDTSPAPMTDTAVRPAKDLSISPTIGRSSSPRINLPEQKSVPVTPPPAPTSTVVTPKQQPAKEPLVLQPFIPLQPPPPDYCSDPRFAGTELCQRRGDGTFPALSSTCATTLLAVGSLDALRQHELCGPEVTALLGAAPTLIEAPKPGAAKATDAKGMPLDVPGAVKIVAPGGAPVAVSGERCLAAFLRLNPVVQQRIVGLFAQYPQARAVHGELARGVMDAPPTFVNWFRDAFSTGSPEASAFCAAVMSAMQGVIPAGAPKGAYGGKDLGNQSTGYYEGLHVPVLQPVNELPGTITGPGRVVGYAQADLDACLARMRDARPDALADAIRRTPPFSGVNPGPVSTRGFALTGGHDVWGVRLNAQIILTPDAGNIIVNGNEVASNSPWFKPALASEIMAGLRTLLNDPSQHNQIAEAIMSICRGWNPTTVGSNAGSQNRLDVEVRGIDDTTTPPWDNRHYTTRSAPSKAATHPFQSGTATFKGSGSPIDSAVLGTSDDKASVEACLQYLAPLPDTVILPALRSIGGPPPWIGQSLGHLNGARDLVAGVHRLADKMSGSDPNRWQALVGFLRSLCAAARVQERSMRGAHATILPPNQKGGSDDAYLSAPQRGGTIRPYDPAARRAAIKAATQSPFQSGTATFGVSGKGDGVRPSGYPLNITIPNPRTEVRLATRPSGDAQGAVAPGWEGVQSFTGQFGGNQGGAFGTGGQQGGLGEAVIPPTQAATQGGLSTQQILGGIGQIGQTGLGFLNQYLDRESRDHLAELQANASSANAQIAANAQIEIARIQAQAQQNIAALGQNPTQQQVSNALNSSIPSGGSGDGMSTGAKVGIGVAVAAVVGGGIYVATRKRR